MALGSPADASPPIGASRAYVDDEDWQRVARTLISESGLIVLGLADTAGVHWEIDTIEQGRCLSKTVFILLPGSKSDDRAFTSLLVRLGVDPEETLAEPSGTIYPVALYFDESEPSANVWATSRPSQMAYEMGIQLSAYRARNVTARAEWSGIQNP